MLAVRERGTGWCEGMQHHKARSPRHHQRCPRSPDGRPGHMRSGRDVFASEAANASRHQVGPLKADGRTGSIDLGARKAKDCRGQGKRMQAGRRIIGCNLRFVVQVIHQPADRWQPEQHASQGTQDEEPKRIAPAHVLGLMGENRHQFVRCESLPQVPGDIHPGPPPASGECRVGKAIDDVYALIRKSHLHGGHAKGVVERERVQRQRLHDARMPTGGSYAVERRVRESCVQEDVKDGMNRRQQVMQRNEAEDPKVLLRRRDPRNRADQVVAYNRTDAQHE